MNSGLKMRMLANGGRSQSNQNRSNYDRDDQDRSGRYSRGNAPENRERDRYESGYRNGNVTRVTMYDPRRSDEADDRERGMYEGEEYSRMNRSGGRREENRDDEWDDEYKKGRRQTIQAGGTFWMDTPEETRKLSKDKAREWVQRMRNADPAHPTGEKWSMDELKSIAQKKGIDPESEKFVEFYAMMNAMYSDYSEVAKQFGVSKPEFYAAMTMAWLDDKDAREGKTEIYYRCIAKR